MFRLSPARDLWLKSIIGYAAKDCETEPSIASQRRCCWDEKIDDLWETEPVPQVSHSYICSPCWPMGTVEAHRLPVHWHLSTQSSQVIHCAMCKRFLVQQWGGHWSITGCWHSIAISNSSFSIILIEQVGGECLWGSSGCALPTDNAWPLMCSWCRASTS